MKPQIIAADCLAAMRKMESASVDLIYLDPPFNTGQVWVGANGMAFADIYKGDIDFNQYDTDVRLAIVLGGRVGNTGTAPYLAFIAERLAEMKRLLKPTGAIYLHCDDTAGAYIKILMDAVFGCDNYRNAIMWKRTNGKGTCSARQTLWAVNRHHLLLRNERQHLRRRADGQARRIAEVSAPRRAGELPHRDRALSHPLYAP